MILIRFNAANSLIKFASLDLISPGVWGSLFYGLGGILGMCAAYERRQPLYNCVKSFCHCHSSFQFLFVSQVGGHSCAGNAIDL